MTRNTSLPALCVKLVLVAIFACVLVSPAVGQAATIGSDKDDYSPGEIVILTGSGWLAGETIEIEMVEEPLTHENVILTSVADADGNFTNNDYLVQPDDLGVTFTVTATGLSSGLQAVVIFTDAGACGNGNVQPNNPQNEQCDDGDDTGGDGCSSTCQIEPGYKCSGNPSVCVLACGDDIVDTGEQCDGGTCCTASCTYASAATACRASAGACDVPETCTGSSANCPADGFEDAGVTCRAQNGDCDVAEECTGSSASCPVDEFADAGVTCRNLAGDCDVAETCTGSSGACPGDEFAASSVECRASGGACDLAENCTGSSATCPADAKSSAECRAAAGDCDAVESCDGVNDACPFDDKLTTECRAAAGDCDLAETCDGASDDCPQDIKSTAECRAAAGDCDEAESCDGVANACPLDEVKPAATECRAANGTCDPAEVCDGSSTACPNDSFAATDVVCREAVDECDVDDYCDGAGSCDEDAFQSSGTECGSQEDTECDNPNTCDGSGACQDNYETAGATCGSADDTDCDNPDSCNGAGDCEENYETAGIACGSPNDTDCDNPDTCDAAGGCLDNYETVGATCGNPDDTDCDNPDTCDAVGDCLDNHEETGTACDDDDACTENEACDTGACTGGADVDCTDDYSCTTDTCDSETGCANTPDDLVCDDDNVCTADACEPDAVGADETTGCDYSLDAESGCEAAITSSSLCPFDSDPDADPDDQFRLIFTPDPLVPTSWKLNASNPGQFYYNAMYVGSGEETLEIEIPYPFVTQGATPVHIYESVTPDDDGCYTPGDELAHAKTLVVLDDYTPQQIGSTTTVGVELPSLAGHFAYINIHLDYGLKRTPGYSKNAGNDAVDAVDPTDVVIPDETDYAFTDNAGGSDTAQSNNVFKRAPGFAGLVLDNAATPVAGVEVEIWSPANTKLKTVYTDTDGWYMWLYKHTGKAATFTVKLPDYGLQQTVTVKSNQFVVTSFTLP